MNVQRGPDSPESGGRKPAGARPAPKTKRSIFPRRQGTKELSDESSSTDASPLISSSAHLRPTALPSPLELDELPLQPPTMFTESPLASPDLLTTDEANGRHLPEASVFAPIPVRAQSPALSVASGDQSARSGRPFRAQASRLNASTPPPSSAVAHWASLRQAILSGSPSRTASPAPSQASFGSARPSAAASRERPAARPARFGRMGRVRAVVQEARVENQEARQFQEAIRQACWQSRYPLPGHTRQKWSMDNTPASVPSTMHGFSTSALHVPFVAASTSSSSVSLPLAGNDPQLAHMGKRRGGPAPVLTSQSVPSSLQPLYHTLAHYASLARQRPGESWLARLPEEGDVLYTLAAPFVSTTQSWASVEQRVSVECFELIRKAWPASDNEDTVERLLWCCETAKYAQSPLLDRLLTFIRSTVMPTTSRQPFTPDLLRSCLWGLFNLQRALLPDQNVSDVLAIVLRAKWVSVDLEAFEEEYDHAKASENEVASLIPLLAAEVMARGLAMDAQFCSWATSAMKDYWPPPVDGSSKIQSRMYSRIILAFNHSAMSLFRTRSDLKILHSPIRQMFLDACQSKSLPYMRKHHWTDLDAGKSLAALLLEMLSAGPSLERSQSLAMIREQWLSCTAGAEGFLAQLREMMAKDDIKDVVLKLTLLHDGGRDFEACFTAGIPMLFDRLAIQLPEPDESLTRLLTRLSEKFPQIFFKPLFTCAGSVKDEVIASQLVSLTGVGRLVPEIWVSNAEMISVAILGDVGSGLGKGKGKEGSGLTWGRTRVGQCVVMLELIREIRRLCGDETVGGKSPDRLPSSVVRFVADLETRIGILINAKEQATLVPFSQRVLLCVLLYHMRRLTRSLKPAPWLSRLSAWACQSYKGAQARNASSVPSSPDDYVVSSSLEVDEAALDEVDQTFDKVLAIYAICGQLIRDLKISKPLSATSPPVGSKGPGARVDGIVDKDGFDVLLLHKDLVLKDIPTTRSVPFLALLVAVNGLLQSEHYRDLGPLIWNRCLDTPNPSVITPASFLFMQCGERFPDMISAMINDDLNSKSKATQATAVRRLSYLLSRRHETLVQFHITDRTHRRPFKGIRQPISFVPTDVGSSQYVGPAEEEDGTDITVGVAKEVKKRLMEIGWVDEDSNTTETNLERLPISLLPSQLLNRLGHTSGHTAVLGGLSGQPSNPDPQKSLLRRKSSSSNFYAGVKRRTIFVSSISSCLQALGFLASEDDYVVAGQAQEVLSGAIRDDVSLVGRPILEAFSSRNDVDKPVAALRALVFAQSSLSPSFAHHVFNHLTGFLKVVARDVSRIDAFHVLSVALPLLSQLAPNVPDVALRDLRRNKVEVLLLPGGTLWFSDSAPAAPMFPRALPTFTDRLDGVALDEVKMVNIRTVQNMIVFQLLLREPKDVYTFEKMVLPIIPVQRNSYDRPSSGTSSYSRALEYSWLAHSRSYLIVTSQIVQSLSSSLSDRQKLSNLLDGVNCTVLAFSADLGVITHALLCYLLAISRFRRLVASQNGFEIFMPALWHVYKAQHEHASIRIAVQTAMRFFYALHDESFIFQAVDSLASAIPNDNVDESVKTGEVLYDLFSSLDPSTPPRDETTGLQQLFTAPGEGQGSPPTQHDLAAGRTVGRGLSNFFDVATTKGVVKRQNRNFPLDNVIRLCLTVIAHDPTSPRAWRFLRVLRALAPKLYDHSTTARGVLRDGIDALGILLTKSVGVRPPPLEPSADTLTRDVAEKRPLVTEADFNQVMILRREYLLLIRVFARAGATPAAASSSKTLLLIRTMLKDSGAAISGEVADFLGEYAGACLSRSSPLNPKDLSLILRDLSQLFQTYGDIVDFSGVLMAVEKLVNESMNVDPSLFAALIAEWCRPALLICEAAAAERRLWDLPLRRAVLSLLTSVVSFGSMEAFALFDKKTPSPSFLAGILLPLTLSMATNRNLSDGNPAARPDVRCSQWLRILSYILPVCQQLKVHASTDGPRRLRKPSPGRSGEEDALSTGQDPLRHRLASAVFAFQILKIVIIQSGEELAEASSRVWTSIAQALLDLLGDASADFLFGRGKGESRSPGLSPPGSSLSTPDNSFLAPERAGSNAPSPGSPVSEVAPRIVDFLFWSTMELVASRRTPLMLYLRVFIQEKIHLLNRGVKSHERRGAHSPVRTSVFVRPRSSSMSPEAPAAQPLRQSFLRGSPASTPSRSPGPSYFQLNPNLSPSPLRPNAPRIVHLGPLPSPGVQASDSAVGSQLLSSPSLAASTKRCIQNVRISLGYPALALDNDEHGSQGDFVPWSRASALARIVEETTAFIDVEFKNELMAPIRTSGGSLPRRSPSPRKDEVQKDTSQWILDRGGIP